jgi:putative two-component system response regulator
MHDIGKIGIPDHILLKPGKLTSEEWAVMKTHSDIGALILSGSESEFLQMAEIIAGSHHERWEGSGYPRGLKGEEIPLVSRIVTVCDVFDALTSDRPYKKAWSIEDAVAEMESQSGKLFDPDILRVFMDLLPEMVGITQQFSDSSQQIIQAQRKTS